MDDREGIAWLHRRVGFGLAPGQLDTLVEGGLAAAIDQLIDPDTAGIPAAPDPWGGAEIASTPQPTRAEIGAAIAPWLAAMRTSPRPLEEWMAWFWHGHFVSSILEVRRTGLMVGQIRTFRRLGLGSFPELVRAVTVDPAMLLYLDGATSTGSNPNENYGRELMELFTVGLAAYTEADVRAAAIALTGWRIDRLTGTSSFVPRRHDDQPQRLLGSDGVHDVDTVVAAVTDNDACAPFIAGKLAKAILGPDVDAGLLRDLASTFRSSGLQLRPLVRAILRAGLDGAAGDLVLAPVPWMVAAERATGGTVEPALGLPTLRAGGQLPLAPPNVGGWPGGRAWLASSTVVAREQLASTIAATAPAAGPAMAAAASGDLDRLADALGRPAGFSKTTKAALSGLPASAVLTLALTSPELTLG